MPQWTKYIIDTVLDLLSIRHLGTSLKYQLQRKNCIEWNILVQIVCKTLTILCRSHWVELRYEQKLLLYLWIRFDWWYSHLSNVTLKLPNTTINDEVASSVYFEATQAMLTGNEYSFNTTLIRRMAYFLIWFICQFGTKVRCYPFVLFLETWLEYSICKYFGKCGSWVSQLLTFPHNGAYSVWSYQSWNPTSGQCYQLIIPFQCSLYWAVFNYLRWWKGRKKAIAK